MAAQRGLPQSKEALLKSYTTRLKDDVKSMLENFDGKGPNSILPSFLSLYLIHSLPIVNSL